MMQHTCDHCHQPLPDFGGIVADEARHEVGFRGHTAVLSRKEFEVFNLLLSRRGRPLNVREAHEHIYQLDPNGGPDLFAITVYICRMRKKINTIGLFVDSHWHGSFSLREPSRVTVAAA